MTVKELITKLEKVVNKDLEVVSEGCDCMGDIHDICIYEKWDDNIKNYSANCIILQREDTVYLGKTNLDVTLFQDIKISTKGKIRLIGV